MSCGFVAMPAASLHAQNIDPPARVEGEPAAPEPAPQPEPPVDPKEAAAAEAAVRKAFGELGDGDPDVREAARAALMGMQRRDLPALRQLVAQRQPLAPGQAAVLREVVTQVYLAGEPYESVGDAGFLGVRMLETAVRADVAREPVPDVDGAAVLFQSPPLYGIVITDRIPGFVGMRMLLDGDVILGIAEHPEVQFASSDEFGRAVRESRPGRPLHFLVLRRGRIQKIAIRLDPRPQAAQLTTPDNPFPMVQFDERRKEKADAYWRETFAPLVRENVG